MEKILSQLLQKINDYYTERADHIDSTVKSDERAMKMLTALEVQETEEHEILRKFRWLIDKYKI